VLWNSLLVKDPSVVVTVIRASQAFDSYERPSTVCETVTNDIGALLRLVSQFHVKDQRGAFPIQSRACLEVPVFLIMLLTVGGQIDTPRVFLLAVDMSSRKAEFGILVDDLKSG
jgi:hypothetical protein